MYQSLVMVSIVTGNSIDDCIGGRKYVHSSVQGTTFLFLFRTHRWKYIGKIIWTVLVQCLFYYIVPLLLLFFTGEQRSGRIPNARRVESGDEPPGQGAPHAHHHPGLSCHEL